MAVKRPFSYFRLAGLEPIFGLTLRRDPVLAGATLCWLYWSRAESRQMIPLTIFAWVVTTYHQP